LTLTAVVDRDGQSQDAEPTAPLVTLAPELAALFPAVGFRVDQMLPRESRGRVVPMLLRFRKGKVHHRVLIV
jgi:hypothetical protein